MTSLLIPPLGDLNAYINAVYKIPLLTLEEEQEYALAWYEHQDQQAAAKLVMSHLRLVVAMVRDVYARIAHTSRQSAITHEDLIQEGNMGLMRAVQKFNPHKGVRLVSYAMAWIKPAITEFVHAAGFHIRRVTSKTGYKFWNNAYNLIAAYRRERGTEYRSYTGVMFSSDEIAYLSEKLDMKPDDIRDYEIRFIGGEKSMDAPLTVNDDGEDFENNGFPDDNYEPTAVLERFERETLFVKLETYLAKLDERTRYIMQRRWFDETPATLQELGTELKVSAERVRQLEARGMKQLRALVSV
jgi:RNA polymerase sigma-32 factor